MMSVLNLDKEAFNKALREGFVHPGPWDDRIYISRFCRTLRKLESIKLDRGTNYYEREVTKAGINTKRNLSLKPVVSQTPLSSQPQNSEDF